MKSRLDEGPRKDRAKDLWAATYLLLGLPCERAFVNQLLREVVTMEESTTYQGILEEGMQRGAIRELRKTLLLQGQKRFHGVDAAARAAIEAITDLERLEQLSVQLLDAASWQELLRGPTSAARSTRRKPKP